MSSPPKQSFPWRGLVALPFALTWALPYAGFAAVYASIAPASFSKCKDSIIRSWGTGLLWILGIKLEKNGRVHGPVIVMFNHVSVLDLALLSATWAGDAVILYKKEFKYYPLISNALKALKMIPIDRSNREAAKESLKEAANRVREGNLSVYVSPEGTRSKHGKLLPFKKGPFHLALETKLKIQPLIMHGISDLIPGGSWLAHSGVIRIDYLEPIETANWQRDTLDHHIEEVRQVYLQHLPDSQP